MLRLVQTKISEVRRRLRLRLEEVALFQLFRVAFLLATRIFLCEPLKIPRSLQKRERYFYLLRRSCSRLSLHWPVRQRNAQIFPTHTHNMSHTKVNCCQRFSWLSITCCWISCVWSFCQRNYFCRFVCRWEIHYVLYVLGVQIQRFNTTRTKIGSYTVFYGIKSNKK